MKMSALPTSHRICVSDKEVVKTLIYLVGIFLPIPPKNSIGNIYPVGNPLKRQQPDLTQASIPGQQGSPKDVFVPIQATSSLIFMHQKGFFTHSRTRVSLSEITHHAIRGTSNAI